MDTHTENVTTAEEAPNNPESATPEGGNPVDALPEATHAEETTFSFDESLENALKLAEEESSKPEETPTGTPEAPEETPTGTPEAPEETPTDDPIEQFENIEEPEGDWTPKAARAFKSLKSQNKTLLAEREEFLQKQKEAESKLEEFEGLADSKEVETLQEKLKEFETKQMFSDLRSTEAYQTSVEKPLQSVLDSVRKIAEDNDANYEELVDAIVVTDPKDQDEKISEALPHGSDRDRANLYRLASELDPILERREELEKNVDKALEEAKLLEETRAKEQAAQRRKTRDNATRNMANRMLEKLPMLSNLNGIDVEAFQSKAADIDPQAVHPVDFAYSSLAGQMFPHLIRELLTSQKEVDSLTSKLAEYDDAEPTLSSGGQKPAINLNSPVTDGGFADSLESRLGG